MAPNKTEDDTTGQVKEDSVPEPEQMAGTRKGMPDWEQHLLCGSHGRESQDPSCHASGFPHPPSSRDGCPPRAGSLNSDNCCYPQFSEEKIEAQGYGFKTTQ